MNTYARFRIFVTKREIEKKDQSLLFAAFFFKKTAIVLIEPTAHNDAAKPYISRGARVGEAVGKAVGKAVGAAVGVEIGVGAGLGPGLICVCRVTGVGFNTTVLMSATLVIEAMLFQSDENCIW